MKLAVAAACTLLISTASACGGNSDAQGEGNAGNSPADAVAAVSAGLAEALVEAEGSQGEAAAQAVCDLLVDPEGVAGAVAEGEGSYQCAEVIQTQVGQITADYANATTGPSVVKGDEAEVPVFWPGFSASFTMELRDVDNEWKVLYPLPDMCAGCPSADY